MQKFYMVLALRWVFCTDLRTDSDHALYIISITVVESVYSAVRTDALYKADYVSSLNGKSNVLSLNGRRFLAVSP
jgi:hypothetical protein